MRSGQTTFGIVKNRPKKDEYIASSGNYPNSGLPLPYGFGEERGRKNYGEAWIEILDYMRNHECLTNKDVENMGYGCKAAASLVGYLRNKKGCKIKTVKGKETKWILESKPDNVYIRPKGGK